MGEVVIIGKGTGKARHPHDKTRPLPAAIRNALARDDIPALVAALSVRQRRFAEEYILDFNASRATVAAGYAVKFADRQGSTLIHHKGVLAYIDYLTKTKANRIMSISPEYLINELTAIIGKEGTKDGDKIRSVELLMKHLGMFIERTEISGPDGDAIKYEKTREDAADFTSAIARLAKRNGTTGVAE